MRSLLGPNSFVIGEYNSVACSGKDSVSNTFGQAFLRGFFHFLGREPSSLDGRLNSLALDVLSLPERLDDDIQNSISDGCADVARAVKEMVGVKRYLCHLSKYRIPDIIFPSTSIPHILIIDLKCMCVHANKFLSSDLFRTTPDRLRRSELARLRPLYQPCTHTNLFT